MFEVGDTIHHRIFKEGKVIEVNKETGMLLVDWDTHLVKRIKIKKGLTTSQSHVKMSSVRPQE